MNDFFTSNSAPWDMTIAFVLALTLSLALKFWLASRQIRHVAQNRSKVPPAFAEKITLAAHQKAADYTITKTRFGLLELAWGAAITIAWTILGGLSALNQVLVDLLGHGMVQQVALFAAFAAIGSVLDLPFTLYQTFVIEEHFGFNKMPFKLWLVDGAKHLFLSLAIGLPFITLVIWMMGATGRWWWLWVWGVWMVFMLLAQIVYPTWIAPWFNKFQPLEDQGVRDRVTQLMARCGFTAKGFFVMDGSKRSAHSNAYFTGFGTSKRVVFYDTLLAQLSPAEVDAVLAHELGHFKHRHVLKLMATVFALSLAGLFGLGWFGQQVWFFTGLGVAPNLGAPNDALALLLFMMVLPLLGTFFGPAFAQMSRKHEFEADAYAVGQTNGQALANALLKLFEGNASTVTPDPVYVQFYYSHPPATERLGRILGQPAAV